MFAAGATLLGILAVIFATGIASGFERPALTALEAQVVPREQAARGVSTLSSVSQAGAILGPAAGGIAIAVIGIPATYAVIAVLLAISTVCLLTIAREADPGAGSRASRSSRASSAGSATSAGRRRWSARWRSTCSRSSSAARSPSCRSTRRTSSTSARSGSACSGRRRRSAPCS